MDIIGAVKIETIDKLYMNKVCDVWSKRKTYHNKLRKWIKMKNWKV